MSIDLAQSRPGYFRGSPAKYPAILKTIRARIVSGALPAGARLPTRLEMERRFRTSSPTIQKALTQLLREGFVESHGRRGTFVAQRLPHLTNYALVFWNDPVSPYNWSRYYMALTNAASAIARDDHRKITLFHGIDQHADNEDRERLLQLIRTQRLAGLIFVNEVLPSAVSALLQDYQTPCVALTAEQVNPRIPVVTFGPQYFDKAMAYLAGQGRKRIAYLGIGIQDGLERTLTKSAAMAGVECPPYWQLAANILEPKTAQHCVQLLLRGAPADRPDGLIIGDDNLVEQVLAGVVTAGVKVPADLEIVAHCNFPWPPASVLPVKRLGFNIHDLLLRCVEIIDRQRRAEPVPGVTAIPAIFEEELVPPVARGAGELPALAATAHRERTARHHTEDILQEQSRGALP